ncbi:MAG: hypothetical protein P0Y56_14160 [Candidatus Andeanibacterium colombiense]|uniref:Uncharacterized protein n=1 Tax=Candidatus Andeanibacterium colombiense TaxID=3121345 RepID=A0AAJ5X7V2_9SPHN|nr:MAG: hypothetical protein P0Y56_14160 [Sphingomonadaceae bacterium]
MSEALDSWDKAEAFALSLPGTVRSTIYDMPMVMIAKNRRGFLVTGHEAQTSFAVPLDEGYAEMLMETDPDSFWQSPHYAGSSAVLVRYSSADPERVREVIEYAFRLASTRKNRPPRPK